MLTDLFSLGEAIYSNINLNLHEVKHSKTIHGIGGDRESAKNVEGNIKGWDSLGCFFDSSSDPSDS